MYEGYVAVNQERYEELLKKEARLDIARDMLEGDKFSLVSRDIKHILGIKESEED